MAEVGRPTKMTEDVIRKIEEVAALDGSVAEMAFYANVHPDTVYAWLKENKDFSDRINALRNKPVLLARQTVVKAVKDDPNMAMRYLEKKRSKEFVTRTEVENTGDIGLKIKPTQYARVSDEALAEFAELAEAETEQGSDAEDSGGSAEGNAQQSTD